MELKPGYKQTEVGVIPEDWDVQLLQDLSTKIMVGIASAATHAYRNSGVPMFRNQNIKEGWLDKSDLRFLDPAFDEAFRGKRLCGGDLLTARTGYPGTTAVVPPEYTGAQSFTSLIIRPDTSKISSSFLCLYINSPAGKEFFEQSQIGGAQKNVNANTLKRMPVAFPRRKEEQNAIASVAAEIDTLTSSLEALISKKRAIKQAAMQELLTGKRRLPGFEGEWVVKRLGDIAEITMGQSPSSHNYNKQGKGLPLIQGNADIKNRESVPRGFTTQITKRGFNGDILMTVRAPVGEVSRANIDVCLGRGVCAIRFPSDFLYHFLVFLEPAWAKHSKGSTFDSVNAADIKAVDVHLPCDSLEQDAIAESLGEMDAELTALEIRLAKAHAIKQGMMQQLLTGKIRLT